MRLIGILSAPSSGVAPKVMLVDDDGKGWIMNEGEVWSGEIPGPRGERSRVVPVGRRRQ